jgi:hypothetical protein
MLYTVLPEKAAITLYIKYYDKVTRRLHNMKDQKSLMLHWCSFSGWGTECDTFGFAPDQQNVF